MTSQIVLPKEIHKFVKQVTYSNSANFCELVHQAGLNPAIDFLYADLSQVDFSNCDLRGFNFRGANLTDCIGIGVQFDETTNFSEADVDRSCFEYYCTQKTFFEKNDNWKSILDRIANAHFTTSVNWIADNLNDKLTFKDGPWFVASKLMDATDSKVIRSNILYFALPLFRKTGGHLDFLLYVLSSRSAEISTVKSIATALASIYTNDKVAQMTLVKLLHHVDATIRHEAIRGIFNSRDLANLLTEVFDAIVLEESSENRRYFLKRLCSHYDAVAGKGFSTWTTEPAGRSVQLDFRNPIDIKLVEKIARRSLERLKFAKHVNAGLSNGVRQMSFSNFLEEGLTVLEEDLKRERANVTATLRRLTEYGVPFDLSQLDYSAS